MSAPTFSESEPVRMWSMIALWTWRWPQAATRWQNELQYAAAALIVHCGQSEEARVLPCRRGVLGCGLAELVSLHLVAVVLVLIFHDRPQLPVRAEDRKELVQQGFKVNFPPGSVREHLYWHSVALPGSDVSAQ
ncbi:hypothetical protein [Streptomyces xanthophaeus]|nr:hypothetical protein [Streptomyces xanthophaeus]